MLVGLSGCVLLLASAIGNLGDWAAERVGILLAVGGFACWRWSWTCLHLARAALYRYWTFPRIRRMAAHAEATRGPIRKVDVLITTYRERPWITSAVFESVFRELSTLQHLVRRPRVVVATGCDEDDASIRSTFSRCCEALRLSAVSPWPPELVLLRSDEGKRRAIADALRELAPGNQGADGAVVFMDGDTVMSPGLLRKVLPMFVISPPVAALTTNEDALTRGPAWFAEWLSLRFGQRHLYMCSLSLSRKLLCLTGRLSVFRASVASDPTFRAQVKNDWIDHWLWGPYQMLSGDDKSTWYWLASRGEHMLYVPDALATTIEVVEGSALLRALANMRRWSGNMLRTSWRAIALGPGKLGLFPWWCVVDQRLSIWTAMVGPITAVLAVLAGQPEIAAAYLLWVVLARTIRAAVAWRHGRRFSAFYIPLQVFSEWSSALIKAWLCFHPAKQSWLNRGGRTLDSTANSAFRLLRRSFAGYLWGLSCTAMVLLVGTYVGVLPVFREAPLFLAAEPQIPGPAPGPGAGAPLAVLLKTTPTRLREKKNDPA